MQNQKSFTCGIGIRRQKANKTLDVTFPIIETSKNTNQNRFINALKTLNIIPTTNGLKLLTKDTLKSFIESLPTETNSKKNQILKTLLHLNLEKPRYATTDLILFFLFEEKKAILSTEEAFFKLHCISKKLYQPNHLSLEGMFGHLNNLAWTNKGPILINDVEEEKLKSLVTEHPLQIFYVDKIPHLLNYMIPKGVRIASGSQARLGAYLGTGTTIMPAGYVNFNAGTIENCMIEGRVSAGVVLEKDSDIGGGASIMGTLSGGGKTIIHIGQKCLIGANAGTGISLGDGCTIAAGVYITSGTKISLYNKEKNPINLKGALVKEGDNITKGIELSGKENLLFLQDSTSGKIICYPNKKSIELNQSLHQND